MSAAAVRDGAAEIPYSYVETKEIGNGTYAYSGCLQQQNTDRVEKYTRADSTVFNQVVGAGAPLAATYICSESLQARVISGDLGRDPSCNGGGEGSAYTYTQNRLKKINTQTGASFYDAWYTISSTSGTGCGGAWKSCSAANANSPQAEVCASGTY